MEKKKTFKMEPLGKTWYRLPVVIRAIIIGFLVSTLGVVTWPLVGTTIPMPWSFILMIGILGAYLKFFSGQWGPKSNKKTRAIRFRTIKLSRQTWILSLLAAVFIVLIEQSGLVITFRLIDFPAERFTEEYGFIKTVPTWVAWLAIIMISAVAGICEEVGFRGYMQVPMEKNFSPLLSIAIVSVVFVLVHLHQAWSGPILAHVFFLSVLFGSIAYYSGSLIPGIIAHFIIDICNFSFWWTDLGGQFNRETIHQTGVDSSFIVWLLVLVLSMIFFVVLLHKINLQKKVYNQQIQAPE